MTETTRFTRIARFAAVPALALTMLVGSTAVASADHEEPTPRPDETCEADRSNHLLGGLLTDELNFVADLLPFTIAGEQFPNCDAESAED